MLKIEALGGPSLLARRASVLMVFRGFSHIHITAMTQSLMMHTAKKFKLGIKA